LGTTAVALATGASPITEKVLGAASIALQQRRPDLHTPQRYSAGQGFTERPNHVNLARNEGRQPVVVLVTYLGLIHGVNPDVPAKSPGNCPFQATVNAQFRSH